MTASPPPSSGVALSAVQFQKAQAAIAKAMIDATLRALQKFGSIPATAAARKQFAARLLPEMMRQRQRSYQAAIAHMRYTARVAGEPMPAPADIRVYGEWAIESVLERVADEKPDPTAMDQVSKAAAKNPDVRRAIAANMARHAQAAGRDAIEQTANEHGEEIGWARVLTGAENCAWCMMLASRGPAYRTQAKALYKGGETGNPWHTHCVVPGTLVSGPDTEVGYRRHYEGEIVTLVTAAGHELSITPQHPVLTDRGWVPAGLLNVGDKLVSSMRADRNVVRGPYVDQVPARIEDVVGALGVPGSAAGHRVPGSAEQFHGDGFASEVSVVTGHDLFRDVLDAALGEPSAELNLQVTAPQGSVGGFALPVLDVATTFGGRPGSAAHRVMRGGGLLGTLPCGHPAGTILPGLAAASLLGTGVCEPAGHDSSRDAVVTGQGEHRFAAGVTTGYVGGCIDRVVGSIGVARKFDPPTLYSHKDAGRIFAELGADLLVRLAGSVHLDDLVDKRVGVHVGDVLNLSTREGWYSANSITVSNCDCSATLVFLGKPWEGQAEQERLEDLWAEVTKGHYGDKKFNAFRRHVDAQNGEPDSDPDTDAETLT